MKPCSNNRKAIAWLTLGELDAQQASTLQEHLTVCDGCRNYRAQISRVNKKLTLLEQPPDIRGSEFFHQKLTARLRLKKPASAGVNLQQYFFSVVLNWRFITPVAAVFLILGLIAHQWHFDGINPLPAVQSTALIIPTPKIVNLSPTIGNYEMAANQSLDKLDELFARQERENLPPAPVYKASMLTLSP